MVRVSEESGLVRLPKRFTRHGGKRLMDIPVGALVPIRSMKGIWLSTKKTIDAWLNFLARYPGWVESPLREKVWPHKRRRLEQLTDSELQWLVTEFKWNDKQKTYQWFAEKEYQRRIKRGCYDGFPEVDLKPLWRQPQARVYPGELGYRGKPSGWGVSNPCNIGDFIGVELSERRMVRAKLGTGNMVLIKVDGRWMTWKPVGVIQREPRKDRALQERKKVYGFRPLTQEEVIGDKVIELWDEIWEASLDQLRELNDKVSWMVAHRKVNFIVEAMLRDELEKRMEEVLAKQDGEWVRT